MDVSILDFFEPPRESVELATAAERLGYKRYWIGEHHAPCQCPNPVLLSAIIAQHTRTLRIGTGASSITLRNLQLLAEDATTLECVSPARLDLGVSPGLPGIDAAKLRILNGRPYDTDDYPD